MFDFSDFRCFFGMFGLFFNLVLLIISSILNIVCDCLFLSKSSNWKVQKGFAPKNTTINISYFNNITVLGLLLYTIYISIESIYILINGGHYYSAVLSHISLILIGIVHIGICGIYGISCGFINIFVGLFFFVAWLCIS